MRKYLTRYVISMSQRHPLVVDNKAGYEALRTYCMLCRTSTFEL